MRAPYIGVTGIVTDADVAAVTACVPLVPPSHRLMTGVLASAKTLRGERTLNRRYPLFRDVERLLAALSAAGAWPVVHFNCRRDDLSDLLPLLAESLPSMRGLQLNIARPSIFAVGDLCRARPDVEFILQANRSAAPSGESVTAEHIGGYVAEYGRHEAHALIDLSGGRGESLNVDLAADLLRRVWRDGWLTRPGVAGGFGPDAIPALDALRVALDGSAWPLSSLSFDAESRVRLPCADPIVGEPYQDDLDPERAFRWVALASDAIRAASGAP
ncbi:MAG: hypothetical protein EPO40_16600 [Myxococcaceae bacterium]|nr:MAG: hypothetical protein EPO40_16600 [Myxococcaceae bacterium]